MFMRKLRKDKRGLSLIELVCALAILAIITTTIGGAMVFASNSYRQGSVDTALQQEAQFTINAIESLIIDATNEVSYTGGVLTINNQDYKYIITYNSADKTLKYSQYNQTDGKAVVEDELLAEHVAHFKLDDTNFKSARTVSIEMTLENGNSKFASNYNVTSRNDPSAGDPPEIVAKIDCYDFIVLEPLQEYVLDIDILGPSNKGFDVKLEGNSDTTSDAKTTIGGAFIKLGAMETGGDDGQLRLLISTNATDSTGSPFTKYVTIRVRRVTDVALSPRSIVGTDCKAGTTYTCTASPVGTFLEQQTGVTYDEGEHAFIDPNTFRWEFEINDGSDPAEWLDVVGSSQQPTITIKLKKDLEIGDKITARAYALHPEGVMSNGALTNKATRAAYNAGEDPYNRPYDSKYNEFYIEKSNAEGNSDFKRGDEFYIQLYRKYKELIQEDWEKNGSKYGKPDYDESQHGFNSGFAGNHHFRYWNADESSYSVANNDDETGYTYPYWRRAKDCGNDPERIKFNEADLAYMKYMEPYTLQFIYSFKYNSNNNTSGQVFPLGFQANRVEQNWDYVKEWEIAPIEVTYDYIVKNGQKVELNTLGVLTPSASGIGNATNPLVLDGTSLTVHYRTIGPASNQKAGAYYLLSEKPQLFVQAGSTWVPLKNKPDMSYTHDKGPQEERESGTINYGMQNVGLEPGKVYKLAVGGTDGEIGKANFKYGQIHTDTTGWETYVADNPNGEGGRGLIYFKIG